MIHLDYCVLLFFRGRCYCRIFREKQIDCNEVLDTDDQIVWSDIKLGIDWIEMKRCIRKNGESKYTEGKKV